MEELGSPFPPSGRKDHKMKGVGGRRRPAERGQGPGHSHGRRQGARGKGREAAECGPSWRVSAGVFKGLAL